VLRPHDAAMEDTPLATTTTVTVGLPPPPPERRQHLVDSYRAANATSLLEAGSSVAAQSGLPVVWCGGHAASECAACPAGYGPGMCNGECSWDVARCYFRLDLYWCGMHASPTCSDCISVGASAEANVKWCGGDCEMFEGDCMPRKKIEEIEHIGPTKLIVNFTGLPPPQSLYYNKAEAGVPLDHHTQMSFVSYGCCAFSETEAINMQPQSAADCMASSLIDDGCIAADVGGHSMGTLFGGRDKQPTFTCNLYSGEGKDFTTGCDETYHCYRKILPGATSKAAAKPVPRL